MTSTIMCKSCGNEIKDTKYSCVDDITFDKYGNASFHGTIYICDSCAHGMDAAALNELLKK